MSWDVSEPQIFSPLLAGATMCIASSEARKDPLELASFIQKADVTFTYFTPTQFAVLMEAAADTLRQCRKWRMAWFAGEAFPVRLARALYDLNMPIEIWNAYGPCETQAVTAYKVPRPGEDTKTVPIGSAFTSCQHYILDEGQNPVPLGVEGEIYLGGPQTATGYINRPETTEKSFFDDPFADDVFVDENLLGGKMFKTADLGRLDADGTLHFCGRVAGDKMVKLRGLRIDCGEIEQRIFDIGQAEGDQLLTDVSVIARHVDSQSETSEGNLADERQLVAFLVLRKQSKISANAFAQRLHRSLPESLNKYMVPAGYCFLEAMPTTIGGKADRQNLLKRDLENLIRPGLIPNQPQVNGSLELHEEDNSHDSDARLLDKIVNFFRELTKLPQNAAIEPDSNFFDLGGTSLLLMRLQARLDKELEKKVKLKQLFASPTPAGVVTTITGKASVEGTQPEKLVNGEAEAARKISTTGTSAIDWAKEIILPDDSRFQLPTAEADDMFDAPTPTDIFLTGSDTYVGVHVLAELLKTQPGKIHTLGTEAPLSKDELIAGFRRFHLFTPSLTEQTLLARVRIHKGTVIQPHFGFSAYEFAMIGSRIHTIYNMGVPVSLLKSYTDLRNADVRPVFDLIELAACGGAPTAINHLSTWTVPHLQSWHGTDRASGKLITAEYTPESYSPPPNDDQGYIKVRWVTEMLLSAAAQRGFPVALFRSSAMTSAVSTGVPEPRDGIIQQFVMGSLITGTVPQTADVVDFVPVDYLASAILALATAQTSNAAAGGPRIYHVTNPAPMSMPRLAQIMEKVRGKKTKGPTELPVGEWLDRVEMEAADGPGDALRWTAIRDMVQSGHCMWELESGKTREALRDVGVDVDGCPGIGVEFLRALLEHWTAQRSA